MWNFTYTEEKISWYEKIACFTFTNQYKLWYIQTDLRLVSRLSEVAFLGPPDSLIMRAPSTAAIRTLLPDISETPLLSVFLLGSALCNCISATFRSLSDLQSLALSRLSAYFAVIGLTLLHCIEAADGLQSVYKKEMKITSKFTFEYGKQKLSWDDRILG